MQTGLCLYFIPSVNPVPDHERMRRPNSEITFEMCVFCVEMNENLMVFPASLQAVGYKLAVLPIAGALIGGALGGPLGLLAGFKAAGVAAALGGGALGFAGGNLVQKRRKAQVDLQMKQLSLPPPENPPQSSKDK